MLTDKLRILTFYNYNEVEQWYDRHNCFYCLIKFEEETNKMLHLDHGFVWC